MKISVFCKRQARLCRGLDAGRFLMHPVVAAHALHKLVSPERPLPEWENLFPN